MRARLAIAVLATALLAVQAASSATGIKATLKAPAANPQICTVPSDAPACRWAYSIRVTDLKGKPLAAKLTAEIVDPYGGEHQVDHGPTDKPLLNWKFKGTFRDYLEFPPESKGFKLTIRWKVSAKIGTKTYRKVLRRAVTPGT